MALLCYDDTGAIEVRIPVKALMRGSTKDAAEVIKAIKPGVTVISLENAACLLSNSGKMYLQVTGKYSKVHSYNSKEDGEIIDYCKETNAQEVTLLKNLSAFKFKVKEL